MDFQITDFIEESSGELDEFDSYLAALSTGKDMPQQLAALFCRIHNIKEVAGFFAFENFMKVAHRTETLLESLRERNIPCDQEAISVLKEGAGLLRSILNRLPDKEDGANLNDDEACFLKKVTALLHGDPKGQKTHHKRIGEVLIEQGAVAPDQIDVALAKQMAESFLTKPTTADRQIIVDPFKLDRIVRDANELLAGLGKLNAGLREIPEKFGREECKNKICCAISELQVMAKSITEDVLAIQIGTLGRIFDRLPKMVQNLSKEVSKVVQLEVQGAQIEVDKNKLRMLESPIIHLVRNAMTHGIETDSAFRLVRGKTSKGRITVRAQIQEDFLHIEVEDDGNGLDIKRILAKAKKGGLIDLSQKANPTDELIRKLIFTPGFSTSEKVDANAGMGVGLDVVLTNVEAMGGKVGVKTLSGEGSCFTIDVPLQMNDYPNIESGYPEQPHTLF